MLNLRKQSTAPTSIGLSILLATIALLPWARNTLADTNIVVAIDGYKHRFKGGGCQSTMYSTHFTSMTSVEQAQAWDFLFCDINMGYLQNAVRYGTEARARKPAINFSRYFGDGAGRDANGRTDVSDPEVYNKIATNWFQGLVEEHSAGRSVYIARLLNEPDYSERDLSGRFGYPGNPQKGVALIVDRAGGRVLDMLANPAINTNGVPRPLFMFPNTLDAAACVSYLTEIKKSGSYPRGWGLVDIVSTHQYASGASVSTFNSIASAAAGRRMIMSEMYPNRGDSLGSLPIDEATRSVLSLAQLVSVPVNAGFESWWYWQTHYPGGVLGLLEIPWLGPAHRGKHYYGFRQLTSLQPYDAYVLNRSVSGLGNVSVMAMREQDAPHLTISVANNEGNTKVAGIQLQTGSAVVVPYAYYQYLTDATNDMSVSGPTLVTPGTTLLPIELHPYCLTTLRILLGAPTSVPAPLAHWSLDDSVGLLANDTSGNSLHAALGTANTWTNGIIAGAIRFPSDYFPAIAQSNVGTVTQLTYSAWFSRGTSSGHQYIGGSTGTNAWSLYHHTTAKSLHITIGTDTWDTTMTPSPGQWQHVTLTINVPERSVKLFLNGAQAASTVRSAMSPITLNSVFWGARVNGEMDDIWLFDKVLTQSQIEKLHTASLSVKPPSPFVTTTSLTSSMNPAPVGGLITFTARIQTNGVVAGNANGTVIFKDGSRPLSTNTLYAGFASFSSSSLGYGSHSLTAEYSGLPQYYLASTSPPVAQLVLTSVTTTTALISCPNPSAVGSPVTMTAAVQIGGTSASMAGGSMVFKSGTSIIASNLVVGGVATFLTNGFSYGSYSLRAEYSGNSVYLASTSPPLAHLALAPVATTTTLKATSAAVLAGEDLSLTATIEPSVNGGSVVFRDGAISLITNVVSGNSASLTISTLGLGSHSLTAEYSGYGTSLGSTSSPPLIVSVFKLPTATAVATAPNPSGLGGNVVFTAVIKSGGVGVSAGGNGVLKDGSLSLSTNPVVNGITTFSTSALAFGSHLITIQYSGDATYLASTSPPLAQLVLQPVPTTTLIDSFPNPSLLDEEVTFIATVRTNTETAENTEGTMTFRDGTQVLGISGLSSGVAVCSVPMLLKGPHSVTAQYSGYGPYLGSTSSALLHTVQQPAPAISWERAGDYLKIQWPENYLGWILQALEGHGGLGSATNWADLEGTTEVTSTNLPINPGSLGTFFRLHQPSAPANQ